MKGYLQRLVRTAANPAESVRPWTASVFAAGYQDDSPFVQSGESASSAAAMQARGAFSPASAQSRQSSPPTPTSLSSPASLISELPATQIAFGSAQAGQSAYRGPSFSEGTFPEPLIANGERSAGDNAEATEPEFARAMESERAFARRGYDHLLAAEPVATSGIPAVELAVGPLRPSADKNDARAVRNSAAARSADRRNSNSHRSNRGDGCTSTRSPSTQSRAIRKSVSTPI